MLYGFKCQYILQKKLEHSKLIFNASEFIFHVNNMKDMKYKFIFSVYFVNCLHRLSADDKVPLARKRDKPVSEWDDLATPPAVDGLSTAGCGTLGHT